MSNDNGQRGDVTAFSDDDFEVAELGEPGPVAAAAKVASFLIGEGPERRAYGDTGPDPVLLERKVLSKGRPKARRFNMSVPEEAQEYAVLEHRSKTTGEVTIQKIKELVSGIEYALFITWIEYDKPEEQVRERIESTLREKRASFLRRAHEQRQRELGLEPAKGAENGGPAEGDGVHCVAKTARGKPCRLKRKGDSKFCGRHAPPEPVPQIVPMDAPPPTHQALGSNA